MVEDKKIENVEKKMEERKSIDNKAVNKMIESSPVKEEKSKVDKVNEKKEENTKPKKEEVKKGDKIEIKKDRKNEAVVQGRSLPISTKYSVFVCNYIRGKKLDKAFSDLEQVRIKKKAIPMRGEIPHKKGMMSGRYPINAVTHFMKLLKSLKGNAIVNEIDIDKAKISCMANLASRPYRRFGRGQAKRTHVTIKLVGVNNG